jgi:hypothetical protein
LKGVRYILEIAGYSGGSSEVPLRDQTINPFTQTPAANHSIKRLCCFTNRPQVFGEGLATPDGKVILFTGALRVMKDDGFVPSSLCIEWSAHPCDCKRMVDTITELGFESEEMDWDELPITLLVVEFCLLLVLGSCIVK